MHPLNRKRRAFGVASALTMALLLSALLTVPRAGTARAEDDGCDPNEAVACLQPPVEEPGEGGTTAPSAAAPSAAAPAPPRPCPPVLANPTDEASAAAAPSPRCSTARDVVAAVNRANVVYVRALRTLDTSALPLAWGDEALADLQAQVAALRGAGRYATPRLLSISLSEMSIAAGTARVRTVEHWIYQERTRISGAVVLELDEWAQNIYTLTQPGAAWIVVRDVITLLDAPPPVAVASARVVTDSDIYSAGDTVRGTVTNDGSVPITAGGGFACGLLRIEWFGPNGWQKAPIPEPLFPCPAIARIINPGESASQTLPAGTQPGIYRLVFNYSAEQTGALTAYSAPYVVR